jgi:ABC-type cobalt transport system substrate-binding protein
MIFKKNILIFYIIISCVVFILILTYKYWGGGDNITAETRITRTIDSLGTIYFDHDFYQEKNNHFLF